MKIGCVIGRVVCEEKIESLQGKPLLLVQPIDERGRKSGMPIVAVDTVRSGEGDKVMFEGGKEAAMSMPDWFNPCDAAIIGIIDAL
ncbi:MAG: ethanolamine utilization protein EutN [spirochete symbiont of Stewartia floridana]|nr:MAG: ethanolamine utilization protein EutN [spirochete symbiont of Stewartia floridana]